MFAVMTHGINRLDLEISGKLDAEEMRVALDTLLTHARDIKHGRMLYQIQDLDFPSLSAIAVELSRVPSLFGLIAKFDRVAVLADQAWIRKISEIEGYLFPGMEIKAFEPDQKIAAEAWLSK